MWSLGLLGLLVAVLAAHWRDVTADAEYEDTEANDDHDVDFYDSDESEDVPTPSVTAHDTSPHPRIKRFEDQNRGARTLSLDEISEVKGAIKELLAGRQLEQLTTTYTADIASNNPIDNFSTTDPSFTGLTKIDNIDPTKFYEDIIEELIDSAQRQGLILKGENNLNSNKKIEVVTNDGYNKGLVTLATNTGKPERTPGIVGANKPGRTKDSMDMERDYGKAVVDDISQVLEEVPRAGDAGDGDSAGLELSDNAKPRTGSDSDGSAVNKIHNVGREGGNSSDDGASEYEGNEAGETELPNASTEGRVSIEISTVDIVSSANDGGGDVISSLDNQMLTTKSTWESSQTVSVAQTTLTSTTRRKTRRRRTTTTAAPTTTTITTTTPEPEFDIPALVDIIANLTYDFETNITAMFNKTLQRYNIPTCKTPTPSTTETIHYDLINATVVAKCFVCGMKDTGIPQNAYCADAFAGDFLPLVPIDPQARGHIARFRKYCRYMDINGVYENATQPRSIYGRFTGGCSVRWIDLSGVYTQRACRNTRHSMMGVHFASKRMAKLEMALKEVDNGCIISPMASLVPLSRGVSLYARFHACVCTGSWCNITSINEQWVVYIAVLTLVTAIVT